MSATRFNFRCEKLLRASALVVAGASVLGLAACKKGGSVSKDDLALAPKEAELVFGLNMDHLRAAPIWKKASDFITSDPRVKKDYDEMGAACVSFGAANGPESVFVAMPAARGGSTDFEVIVRLKEAVDDAKLNKCVTYLASKNEETVVPLEYGGKKVYASQKAHDKDGGAALLDSKTVVIGSGPWLHRAIDLAAGKDVGSAKQNDVLVGLVKRTHTSDAIWGAGSVPQSARDSFKDSPRLAAMATLKSVTGSLDFASGMRADVDMDTGSDDDAKRFNQLVTDQLAALKKNPNVMMTGMASWLDGVKNEAKGPIFHVEVKYNQQQFDDIVERLAGFAKSLGQSLGGGIGALPVGGPSMGMPGMGAPGMTPEPPSMPQHNEVPSAPGVPPGAPPPMKLTPPSGAGTPGAPPTLGVPGLKQPPAAPPKVAPAPPGPAH